jgi:hypothetical protein
VFDASAAKYALPPEKTPAAKQAELDAAIAPTSKYYSGKVEIRTVPENVDGLAQQFGWIGLDPAEAKKGLDVCRPRADSRRDRGGHAFPRSVGAGLAVGAVHPGKTCVRMSVWRRRPLRRRFGRPGDGKRHGFWLAARPRIRIEKVGLALPAFVDKS